VNKFLGKILKTIPVRIRDKELNEKLSIYTKAHRSGLNALVVRLLRKFFGLEEEK